MVSIDEKHIIFCVSVILTFNSRNMETNGTSWWFYQSRSQVYSPEEMHKITPNHILLLSLRNFREPPQLDSFSTNKYCNI